MHIRLGEDMICGWGTAFLTSNDTERDLLAMPARLGGISP